MKVKVENKTLERSEVALYEFESNWTSETNCWEKHPSNLRERCNLPTMNGKNYQLLIRFNDKISY